jgi:hypothetical protein
MPNGMAIDQLDRLTFDAVSGYAAATALMKVGLVYQDGSLLRMLAPLREYVSSHETPRPEDLALIHRRSVHPH